MFSSTIAAPTPALSDLIEAIWDVDVPGEEIARAGAVKLLPTASSVMVVHYRAPISSDRRNYEGRAYKSVVTGIQREIVTLRPSGPTGSVVVRFKPGGAARFFGDDMQAFADANIELADLVGPTARDRLEEQLRAAPGSAGRLRVIEAFLKRHQSREADPVLKEAVRSLGRSPHALVSRIAANLGIGERQLERRFLGTLGASPKQVVRLMRFEKVIATRYRGAAWADTAAACGFTDQAHMIRDFKALAGVPPDTLMREALGGSQRVANSSLALSGFYNTLFVSTST